MARTNVSRGNGKSPKICRDSTHHNSWHLQGHAWGWEEATWQDQPALGRTLVPVVPFLGLPLSTQQLKNHIGTAGYGGCLKYGIKNSQELRWKTLFNYLYYCLTTSTFAIVSWLWVLLFAPCGCQSSNPLRPCKWFVTAIHILETKSQELQD